MDAVSQLFKMSRHCFRINVVFVCTLYNAAQNALGCVDIMPDLLFYNVTEFQHFQN